MKRTGYLHDNRYVLHDTGPHHPETSDRLLAVYEGVKAQGMLEHLTLITASRADSKWIEIIHDPDYIRRFEELCFSGHNIFDDPDNCISMDSYESAFLAVGGILDTVDLMMTDKIDNAFCAVRPPGHHAERNKAMGFCYFNNIAIAARYLQEKWGIKKVAIIDFDVHHGNGTQHAFEQDSSVFYYSIHEHPSFAFPGTGRDFEVGTLGGQGFTKNSLVLPGQGDDAYYMLIQGDLLPAINSFEPEVILVSTGFDAHRDDEMSDIKVSTECFSWIMQTIMDLAERYCNGRVISILEGGYSLKRLPELAGNHMKILLDLT